jgi:predicted site-specific integrase-resolvase
MSQILIEFRDRLSRFGYQYLTAYFALAGVTIRVKEDTTNPPTEESDLNKELIENLVAIIYSFSGKLYGRRSARFRKLRRCVKATFPPET